MLFKTHKYKILSNKEWFKIYSIIDTENYINKILKIIKWCNLHMIILFILSYEFNWNVTLLINTCVIFW